MLTEKKRTALDALVKKADLKRYGTKKWTRDDETKAVALVREALIGHNSAAAMLYVLLCKDVLYAIPGIKDYCFKGDEPTLEFVETALKSRDLAERCELLEFMCWTGDEYDEDQEEAESYCVSVVQKFLRNQITNLFPGNSDGYYIADMLDDSLRNFKEGTGYYGDFQHFGAVARVLQGMARAV